MDELGQVAGVSARQVEHVARRLLDSWPDTVDLRPSDLEMDEIHRAFLQLMTGLQDRGWMMYEALLVGTGPEPRVLDAVLTAKGRIALGGLDRSELGAGS